MNHRARPKPARPISLSGCVGRRSVPRILRTRHPPRVPPKWRLSSERRDAPLTRTCTLSSTRTTETRPLFTPPEGCARRGTRTLEQARATRGHRSVSTHRDHRRAETRRSSVTEVTHMISKRRAASPKAATLAESPPTEVDGRSAAGHRAIASDDPAGRQPGLRSWPHLCARHDVRARTP